jgi:FG-GAP-like repeat
MAYAVLTLSAQTGSPISFQEPRTFNVDSPIPLGTVLSGDWNGDGKTDLAAMAGRTIWILAGDGSGGFRVAGQVALEYRPAYAAAADLNSDGRTDLLVYQCTAVTTNCVPSGEFAVFLSQGDFQFSSPLAYIPTFDTFVGPPGAPVVLFFQIADLNLDGKPDLLLLLNPPFRNSVALGLGDGRFADPMPGPYTFNTVGIADFNADGIPDVMTLGFYADRPQIYYGRGNGAFDDPVPIEACRPAITCGIMVVDSDGDGKPDLMVWDSSWGWTGNLRLLHGDGRGGFDKPVQLPDFFSDDDSQGFVVTFVDLNGDGIPDAARATDFYAEDGSGKYVIHFYSGQGSNTFVRAGSVQLPSRAGGVHYVDVNADGKPDMVTTDGSQGVLVWLNSTGQQLAEDATF